MSRSHDLQRGERLARIAAELEPVVDPYYLWSPRLPSEPAVGWYWTPKGLSSPQFLGASYVTAEIRLREFRGELRVVS